MLSSGSSTVRSGESRAEARRRRPPLTPAILAEEGNELARQPDGALLGAQCPLRSATTPVTFSANCRAPSATLMPKVAAAPIANTGIGSLRSESSRF